MISNYQRMEPMYSTEYNNVFMIQRATRDAERVKLHGALAFTDYDRTRSGRDVRGLGEVT